MAKNFKIAELEKDTRYTVITIDKWDGHAETNEMTGEELAALANGCAHLYDIHAEKITTRTPEEITADIIEFFKNNDDIFTECIEELDSYNGYLGDDRYYSMDELNEFYNGVEPSEILRRAFYGYDSETYTTDSSGNREYGAFNPNRDYFTYNGYGNFVSSDYKDYTGQLDHYAVEEMSENRDYIDSIDDDEDLAALFDELEAAAEEE